jgi:pre-mRNA-processing factor SLU7
VLAEEESVKEIEWPASEVAEKPEAELSTKLAKKRTVEEMQSGISEEDIDTWKRLRTAANDPMAAFLGKDELL